MNSAPVPNNERYDFVVVGSGFGGSVSAMRLAEKGYRVAIIETGKRWADKDFAATNWDVKRYLWFPLLRCFGPQRISLLKNLMVLHGTGVGGGSLIYANTLMKPKADVFRDPSWPQSVDWASELAPHYATAERMLGVTTNPQLFEAEHVLKRIGEQLGVGESFHPTEVGIYFGEAGKTVPDPYFGGKGPERTGCTLCGGCMVGCRHGAKNTLEKNYLWFAEKAGARIFPELTVTRLTPVDGGYRLETMRSTSLVPRRGPSFEGARVILAAGVLGTHEILFRNRDELGTLPKVSGRLGYTVRTNGESLLGATAYNAKVNYSKGIAIGAAIHADGNTKLEAVKYPSGSSFMRLLTVPLTPDGTRLTRPLKLILQTARRLPHLLRLTFLRDWASNSVIVLTMQSIDTSMRLKLGRGVLTMFRSGVTGEPMEGSAPPPSYLPVAQQAAVLVGREIDGEPQNVASEVLLRAPATAHVLGGCAIASDSSKGVVGADHQVFGHPGLYVCDGSVIPSNLAVNPSLTITALAERFAAQFPSKA